MIGESVEAMKNEWFYRETFTNNTIKLVAKGGFEMATTRAISGKLKDTDDIKINEGHIYRIYGTKEKLFAETFSMIEDEFFSKTNKSLPNFNSNTDANNRFKIFFFNLWAFLLENEDKCRYYTRYYYSAYFKEDIRIIQLKKYEHIFEKQVEFFIPDADILFIIHHIITVMLNFAIQIFNGVLENTEENAELIFNIVYSSLTPYLKK